MTLTEDGRDNLRDAFSESVEVVDEGRHCPPWETLWRSARREMEPDEDEVVLMHVGECPACAAAWRMARELARDAVDPVRAVGADRPHNLRWMRLAAAAGLVLAVLGAGILWGVRDRPVPTARHRSSYAMVGCRRST